jgi:cyclase
MSDGGLVKTVQFRNPTYVGDPINAVRIFNDKQVDELVLLEVEATKKGAQPDFEAIEAIAGEAFMPVAYGGGVRDTATATKLIQLGVEKVVVNAAAVEHTSEVAQIADHLGSSTLVVAIDARRSALGWEVVTHSASRGTGIDVRAHAEAMARLGAGELFLTSVDRDGTMEGYDLDLVRSVTSTVDVPVIACGGAGSLEDAAEVVAEASASAAAAGSLFVFHGRHRAVLITYPTYELRKAAFESAMFKRSLTDQESRRASSTGPMRSDG